MRTFGVVEPKVSRQSGVHLAQTLILLGIHLLVLHRASQAFDEDVIQGTALAIQADADLLALQHAGEGLAGELTALIGIEDLRGTMEIYANVVYGVRSGSDFLDIFPCSILERNACDHVSQMGNFVQFPPMPLGAFHQHEHQGQEAITGDAAPGLVSS